MNPQDVKLEFELDNIAFFPSFLFVYKTQDLNVA